MDSNIKHFKPQPFQRSFTDSTAAFPCRVGPWGDGKTLCMLMKGMVLSQMYPGNQGLIVRKQYRALERSTIDLFTEWTGLVVSAQKQYVEVPGTGSKIYFTHCENVQEFYNGIQGMNLGWGGMEQGEEQESADIFEILFGRIRRILTPNKEIQQALIGLGVITEYIPDFSVLSKEWRGEIEKAIIEKLNLPVRQLMVIANAGGHNWIYKRWNDPRTRLGIEKGYDYSEGKPFENKEYIPASTLKNWETLKITSPKKYNRYVLNSHEDYDIEGSYYAELMSDALKEGRCEIQGLFDVTVPVYTFWDLGIRGSDSTSIWFVQFVGNLIHLVDFYSNQGKGMEFYSSILSRKDYDYAEHWLPWDADYRIQGSYITTRLNVLRQLRQPKHEDVKIVEKHSVAERHQAVRNILNRCKFSDKCEVGVEALNRYHRAVNKAKSTDEETHFLDRPEKDKYSHPADAFGHMAVVYENQAIDGQILGYRGANPIWIEDDGVSEGVTNLLEVR